MDNKYSSNPGKRESGQGQPEKKSVLVLHNDDIHTFEYVMESLEELCDHSSVQAEQCAMITHYKGQCEIMVGDYITLSKIKKTLVSRGLHVTLN